jgi:hypothetical protein
MKRILESEIMTDIAQVQAYATANLEDSEQQFITAFAEQFGQPNPARMSSTVVVVQEALLFALPAPIQAPIFMASMVPQRCCNTANLSLHTMLNSNNVSSFFKVYFQT